MKEDTILEQAELIRGNTNQVIKHLQIAEILEKYGKLYYTGSYALDLMTWNDLDMQLVPNPGMDSKQAFSEIFNHFFNHESFIKGKVINFQGDYKPVMPRGLYLGLNFNIEDLGGDWKLDLWVLNDEDFKKNRLFIEKIQSIMTPEIRQLILELKHQMMEGNNRVPQLGSYQLYQALLEGHTTKNEIARFLNEKGIHFG